MAAGADGGHSPIAQFELKTLVPLKIFGIDASFTNSSFFMLLATGLVVGFIVYAMGGRSLVPTRLQSVAEVIYEFVANTVRENIGEEGMKFFPLVFSLFVFVLVLNLIGMIPGGFTVTSHIIITAALAAAGDRHRHRLRHRAARPRLLQACSCRRTCPRWLLPLMVPIEVISFISRPISLSVRLFANMLAGHIALKIFAGFVGTLLVAGAWGPARSVAAGADRRADGAGAPCRRAAGLRVRGAHLRST